MNEREKEIAALSIEWEGSITLSEQSMGESNKYVYIRPCVTISNTRRELLDFMQDLTGFGHIDGPYYRKGKENAKPTYLWRIRDYEGVKSFLEEILPYLITKQEQAELTLAFCKEKLS